MHQANVKAAKSQSTLIFQPVSSTLTEVIRAEVKVATLLVQRNIPLALADELTPLYFQIDCQKLFFEVHKNSMHSQ